MRALALLLCVPLLMQAQTPSPTKKAVHPKPKSSKATAPEYPQVSAYMRHIALLYWEEEEKILKARATNQSDAADAYKHALDKLEKDIDIDLDSDPCSVDCNSPEKRRAAHADQTFFTYLRMTRVLADTMSLRLGYDGSDDWRAASPDKLTESDKDLIEAYTHCEGMVDLAVKEGFLGMDEKCAWK